MKQKMRTAGIILAVILAIGVLPYLGGVIGQTITNYNEWMEADGLLGKVTIAPTDFSPGVCYPMAFTLYGLLGMAGILAAGGGLFLYLKFSDKTRKGKRDPRGFSTSSDGLYGTASWMTEKEMKSVLEVAPIEKAEGTILGEYRGKAACMPEDTMLNRHIAIFGASGTMKTRAIIQNQIFQVMKRGESFICADSKGRLYGETAEMLRQNGYDVKVLNLVNPEHSDCWNCMSDLNGDSLMAQTLTNVIIGNTSSGKGDHFWDNGEANLLKALILYVDQNSQIRDSEKNLGTVYNLLTQSSEKDLMSIFSKLNMSHPAKAPFTLFAQSSDTVKSGIVLGLGTRLQVMQNKAVQRLTSQSAIDLEAPAKRKCAYYIILSDQDTTMAFLSSLFFSLMFIKLTRFADRQEDGRCQVPVNLILDEFNNIGRIGGAEDGSDFARSLSVIRSRDIRVMLAVQSLGQLQNRYPNNLWSEIVGNCDIQLMLGCTDGVTAEYFSQRSGDVSIIVDSSSTTRRTMAVAQVIPQYRQTEGHGKRRLLTPDEVLRLDNRELLVVIRGCNLLKLGKLDYTRHPYAQNIQKCSVMKYKPERPENLPEPANVESQAEKADQPAQTKPAHKTNTVLLIDDDPGAFF